MMDKLLEKLPERIRKFLGICSQIAESLGYKVFLVGGVVRDLIMDRENFDLDIVVEGEGITFAQQVAKVLKSRYAKHHGFGTASVYLGEFKIDIATARREKYPKWGALPEVEEASLKEDLFRRDFTINAMAISLNKADYGKLVDFYGGLKDLTRGVIRILHPGSFLEDPTRILRAIRFHTRFSFSMEKDTLNCLKIAIKKGALEWVTPHRLRDELVLILKEPAPYRYIIRINKMVGLSFIDKKLVLTEDDFRVFPRIERAITHCKNFGLPRPLYEWLVYLIGLVFKLPKKRLVDFCQRFAFKKGETMRLLRAKEKMRNIKKLSAKVKEDIIYRTLNSLSFEEIIFFYAYFKDRKIRKNIDYFLKDLYKVRLEIKGKDLKNMHWEPAHLYSRVLQLLLYRKIKKKLVSPQEEILEAEKIFKYLLKTSCKK